MQKPLKVTLVNASGEKYKEIEVGFCWTIFFFSWITLFLRGFWFWGILLLGITALVMLVPDQRVKVYLMPLLYILPLGLAIVGNKWTARKYLKRGWTYLEPDSVEARFARKKWHLDDDKEC
jgi:hypothetical protein